jgi:hypothetical protein
LLAIFFYFFLRRERAVLVPHLHCKGWSEGRFRVTSPTRGVLGIFSIRSYSRT